MSSKNMCKIVQNKKNMVKQEKNNPFITILPQLATAETELVLADRMSGKTQNRVADRNDPEEKAQ